MRSSEKLYPEEQLDTHQSDMGKVWNIMNDVIGKHSKKQNNILLNINGTVTNNKAVICKAFNTYFVEVGPKLAEKFNHTVNLLSYVKSNINSIAIPPISENKIINIIDSLTNSAPGCDDIPAIIAKRDIQQYIKATS